MLEMHVYSGITGNYTGVLDLVAMRAVLPSLAARPSPHGSLAGFTACTLTASLGRREVCMNKGRRHPDIPQVTPRVTPTKMEIKGHSYIVEPYRNIIHHLTDDTWIRNLGTSFPQARSGEYVLMLPISAAR